MSRARACAYWSRNSAYKIVARLYTPSDADLFEYGPTKTHPTYIAAAESDEYVMLSAR